MPGGDSADCVAQAGAEQVQTELIALAAIHAGEDNLEQDLRLRVRNLDVEQVHDLARGGGNLDRAIGAVDVVGGAAEEDGAVLGTNLDGLAGKLLDELAANAFDAVVGGSRAGANLYVEELPVAALFPNDQAGFSRGFAFTKISVGLMAMASAKSPRPTATRRTGFAQSTNTELPATTKRSFAEPWLGTALSATASASKTGGVPRARNDAPKRAVTRPAFALTVFPREIRISLPVLFDPLMTSTESVFGADFLGAWVTAAVLVCTGIGFESPNKLDMAVPGNSATCVSVGLRNTN